jgi:hypothetical protein
MVGLRRETMAKNAKALDEHLLSLENVSMIEIEVLTP